MAEIKFVNQKDQFEYILLGEEIEIIPTDEIPNGKNVPLGHSDGSIRLSFELECAECLISHKETYSQKQAGYSESSAIILCMAYFHLILTTESVAISVETK